MQREQHRESLKVRKNIGGDEYRQQGREVGSDHEGSLEALLRILDFILSAVGRH